MPGSEGQAASPAVSILLPIFNAARTLVRAIDSVVDQSVRDWTLICIDDASGDGSSDLVEAYKSRLGNRVQLIRCERNGGPAPARNRGLAAATGQWIALLDADDAWHPERLEHLLREANRADADIVCDNLLGFDDHRSVATAPLFASLPLTLDVPTVVAAEYGGRYNLGYLKPLVRRAFAQAHGLRYDEALRTGEDLLFLLACLAAGGRGRCIDWPGYIYTTPVGHASRRLSRSTSTVPRDADLLAALERFLVRNRHRLDRSAAAAIEQRIAYLGAIAPFANFRHARLNRDWVTALRLFVSEPRIRQQIWTALRAQNQAANSRRTPG